MIGNKRGVHKAPTNKLIKGAIDLEFLITKRDLDILIPRGVNCIRTFPDKSIRIWGARTLSTDDLWIHVNVSRLLLFLKESIEEGTQWVVFEPNNGELWDKVKQAISEFLIIIWREGALVGTSPEEAFFVKCDCTTITQNDIDNGRLIVMVGVAPIKTAEFVTFQISQWTGC